MPEIKIEKPDAVAAAMGIWMGLYEEDRSSPLTSWLARAEAVVASAVAAAENGDYHEATDLAASAIQFLRQFIAEVNAAEQRA